jgi:hypothetical protein
MGTVASNGIVIYTELIEDKQILAYTKPKTTTTLGTAAIVKKYIEKLARDRMTSA